MIKNFIRDYKALLLIQLIVAILFFYRPEIAIQAWIKSISFFVEVMSIMPPILIIIALLDAWIPRQAVETYLGENSGARGWVAAILLGSAAAGPLFAAFPMARSLANKGARISNIVIFLSSWSTIKLPLLIMEGRFMGIRFALLRLLITLPLIVLMGVLMEKTVSIREAPNHQSRL